MIKRPVPLTLAARRTPSRLAYWRTLLITPQSKGADVGCDQNGEDSSLSRLRADQFFPFTVMRRNCHAPRRNRSSGLVSVVLGRRWFHSGHLPKTHATDAPRAIIAIDKTKSIGPDDETFPWGRA
jgi:hypothetical protein